jgi:hypothetical protein
MAAALVAEAFQHRIGKPLMAATGACAPRSSHR